MKDVEDWLVPTETVGSRKMGEIESTGAMTAEGTTARR
jgi:hypothetical protein